MWLKKSESLLSLCLFPSCCESEIGILTVEGKIHWQIQISMWSREWCFHYDSLWTTGSIMRRLLLLEKTTVIGFLIPLLLLPILGSTESMKVKLLRILLLHLLSFLMFETSFPRIKVHSSHDSSKAHIGNLWCHCI